MKCQCEAEQCHGPRGCGNAAMTVVQTIYGPYNMCAACAKRLPAEYKSGHASENRGFMHSVDSKKSTTGDSRRARLHRALDHVLDRRGAKDGESLASFKKTVYSLLKPHGLGPNDDSTQRFGVRNSWGTDWGMQGYFTIPYTYLTNSNLASDFWMITK